MFNTLEITHDAAQIQSLIADLVSRLDAIQNDNATLQNDNATLQNDNATLQNDNATLQQRQKALEKENALLRERVNLLLALRFARRSEKSLPGQLNLFDEAEITPPEEDAEETDQPGTGASPPRRKRGRKPLPAYLPRVEVVHDLSEEQKVCPLDGTTLEEIGRETSEQLDIIPAKMQVIRHVRIKYGCPCCHQGVVTAPLPPQPIPKSNASPGLLAHVAVCKYVDGLPLYRQESIFQRIAVDITRATQANWMVQVGGPLVQPLINLMQDTILGYDILQMDETTVQVLKEEGRPASSKSYIWVRRGGPPDRPVILYDYDPSRGAAVAGELLLGYQGHLQTDGYIGYQAAGERPGVVHLGCWAHARRKFDEAIKAAGKSAARARQGLAGEALAKIRALYAIEKRLRDAHAPPEIRYETRQEQAKPLLDDLHAWMNDNLPKVLPSSATGQALGYLKNQWQRLIRYLDDGRLEIDNNLAENAIRPFVLGRKNWLFSDSVKGVKSSANLYSLIETAKANGIDPYAYLRILFTQLPAANTVDQYDALLPWNITKSQLDVNNPG